MAGTITHKWNGTVLTITSDSGTSSADLKGATGDDGIRGPQGPAGIIIGDTGNISLEGYATKDYVDEAVANASTGSVDLSNYYTKTEVDNKIPNLSGYALKTEIPTVPSNVSAFTNDAGYITEHQSLTDYATKTYVDEAIANASIGEVDLTNYATKDYVTGLGYQTEAQVLALIQANIPASGDEVSY